jgi:Lower baseplate protein N-terminal domain
MPSSYTTSLRLVLPVTGELPGAWGDTVNNGLTQLVEAAIAGSVTVPMGNANTTLTTANEAADQARNMFVNCTGAHTAQRDLIVPSVSKLYFVSNGTTGGFGIQVKTAAGSGIVVPNGQRAVLYCDGTNVLNAFTTISGVAPSAFALTLLVAADAAAARTTLEIPTTAMMLTGDQSIAGVKTFTDRLVAEGAYTPSLQPTHSATPTFDCAQSNVFEPAALTGNVTSLTLNNPVGGQTVNIRFVQDATGGRTVAVPSGAKVTGNMNPLASGVAWLVMTYSARASRWEGSWQQVPA